MNLHTGRVIVLLFLLLSGVATWLSLGQLRIHSLEVAAESLWSVNRLTSERLKQQSRDMIRASSALVENPPVHGQLLALLTGQGGRDARFELRRSLAAWLVAHHFRDFYLLSAEGRIIAGMREAVNGQQSPQAIVEVLHCMMCSMAKG